MQERGTECGECRECSLGFREISLRIPGNALILPFRGIFEKIPGNVPEDTGECSTTFWGMLLKIPGNVREDSGKCNKDSGECSGRFRGMLSILN